MKKTFVLTLALLSLTSAQAIPFSVGENHAIEQQKSGKVRGVVKDSSGEPLIGVTVSIKGTSNGTITDMDGNFVLDVPANATIIFSYIGYKTLELPVKDRMNVVMVEDSKALEEVVVIGYGVARKSDLTGSVSNLSSDKITERQVVNPVDALSGKISGVQVNNNSGRPGGAMNIVVRGHGSINASNEPLFVIDGVVGADISMVNPNEIESMNVLKDASSTAIYGARGAAGVILVTTKRGSYAQKTSLTYNFSLGVSKIARKQELLNSSEFMQVLNQGFANDGFEPVDWHRVNPNLFDENNNPIYDTDWQDELTRTAISHRHYVTLNSGSEKSRTTLSLGYQDEQGIMLESFYTRFNAKLANDTKFNDFITLSSLLSYNYSEEKRLDDYRVGANNQTRTMLEMYPIVPVKYADGTWSKYGDFYFPTALRDANGNYVLNEQGQRVLDYNNPSQFWGYSDQGVQISKEMDRRFTTSHLLGNLDLTINILEGLTFKSTAAAEVKMFRERIYTGTNLLEFSSTGANAYVGINNSVYWQSENFLTYNKDFGFSRLNLMGGASWNGSFSESLTGSGQGYVSDFYQYYNLGLAQKPGIPTSGFSEWRMNSYYARANYSLFNKYLFTATARYDGSSVFGKDNRYAFFPSAAVAWVVKEEDFLKDVDFISNLKLRGSIGQTGNAGIGAYSTLATLASTNVVFGGEKVLDKGMVQGGMPNSTLKWETTTQYDLGVDLGLLNNRIMLQLDMYLKDTKDLLLAKPVSWITGYSSVMDNIGQIQNKGLEITLNTHNVKQKDFNWYSTLLFSTNKNKVVKLTDDSSDIWNGNFIGINYSLIREGEALNTIYGLKRDGAGTWGTDEAEEAAKYGKKPGDKKYVDRNQDGKIDYENDGFVLGNLFPKFEMSLNNTIAYKNFDFSLDIQGKYGNKAINISRMTSEQRTWYANSPKAVLNYWTPDNQNTMIERPRTTIGGSPQEMQIDDNLIEDASYIRFKNLMIGYTFPTQMTQKLKMQNLRIYASVENFGLITGYSGFDPEVSNMVGQGVEFFAYPKAMNFNFGLSVKF